MANDPVVDAVNDLTRITLMLHGGFANRSEAIRRMNELAIPTARIAAILAVPPKDVSSVLSKSKKNKKKDDDNG